MSDVLVLFGTEVRRCLARRLVWVLVALAVVAIALASVLAFVNTSKDDATGPHMVVVTECNDDFSRCVDETVMRDDRLKLTDLWPEGREDDDRILAITVVFLAIGGLLGGASMVGADWRAGSITTLLTWEPRRARLAITRFAAVACCAFVIALALQVGLILGLLPAILAHGTTDGADGAWFGNLLAFFLRSESLVAMAAVLGAAIAMIGRNTAAALGASFAYMLIGENVVRAWKPWLRPWLLAENAFIFLAGFTPDELTIGRGFGEAAATLLLYTVGVAAVAVAAFRVRDVTAA